MSSIQISNLVSKNMEDTLDLKEATNIRGGLETTIVYVDKNGVYKGHRVIDDGKIYDVRYVVQ